MIFYRLLVICILIGGVIAVAMLLSRFFLAVQEADASTTPVNRITGTDGADVIVGTAGRDLIFAQGGDDVVRGLGGDDRLYGGRGEDTLMGGEGRDRLDGSTVHEPNGDVVNDGVTDRHWGQGGQDKAFYEVSTDRVGRTELLYPLHLYGPYVGPE